jgi:hypothetical protein
MNASSDRELQQWMQVWRSGAEPQASAESIHRYVVRRRRLLRMWIAAELAIVAGGYALLLWAFMAASDPIDRAALAVLAMIVTGALVLSWWTWRGMLRTPGDTTAAWLAQALERTCRARRGVTAGWWLLAAELAVFIPWIGFRLPAELSAWGLLAAVTTFAVAFLLAVGRWVRRDAETLERIGRDLRDDEDGPSD